jgi:type VI secretion system Hcp family effector
MAFDAYLYFPGSKLVKGEVLDSEMNAKFAFKLNSFDFGAEKPTTVGTGTGGGGSGSTNFNDFNFEKHTDTASNGLFNALCTGHHFKDAVLELRRSGGSKSKSGKTFFRISFKLVIVTGMNWNGTDGDEMLTETLNIKYGAIKTEYWIQTIEGTMKKPQSGAEAMWSQQLNEAVFSVKEAR